VRISLVIAVWRRCSPCRSSPPPGSSRPRPCCRPGSPGTYRRAGATRTSTTRSPSSSRSPSSLRRSPAGDHRHGRRRDDHARLLRRAERACGQRPRTLDRRRLRDGAGPARPARAVPARDPGPAGRGARRVAAAGRHRRPPRLLHAGRAAADAAPVAGAATRAVRRLCRGRQPVARPARGRPVAAADRVRAARAHPGAVAGARLGLGRRPAGAHDPERRGPRAAELGRAAAAGREALRPVPAAAPARAGRHGAGRRRALPVQPRPHAQGRADRLPALTAMAARPAAACRRPPARRR
jgi:hypothetical protein